MYELKRTDQEIDKLLNESFTFEAGDSPFWGMSYEQGIQEGIRWLLGELDEYPLER